MINRFRKITNGLYRGSAPSENDVRLLQKYLKIKKIISLDKETGEAIKSICDELGIEHIIIPLNGRKGPLAKLMSYDLYDLLMGGGPTFFHCMAGKDRTGFVAAMFKCLYMGWTYDQALEEAKSLGFGVGVSPFIIGMYSNILKKICDQTSKELDSNNSKDIVTNERSYKSDTDGRGSYLDQATQGSFAPYLSKTRQYPYDNDYNPIYEQSPTRENYSQQLIDPYTQQPPPDTDGVPIVGYYNSNAGIRGFGPVEPVGGFIYN